MVEPSKRARELLAAWKPIPCDVRLPPNTVISAGCKLSTLIEAMEARREAGLVHFGDRAALSPPDARDALEFDGQVADEIEKIAPSYATNSVERHNLDRALLAIWGIQRALKQPLTEGGS